MGKKNEVESTSRFDRRDFLKLGVTAGVGAAVAGFVAQGCETSPKKLATKPGLPKVPPIDPVRVGFIGVGHRGAGHVRNFLKLEGVQIKAICDIVPEKAARMRKWVVDAGFPEPAIYTRGEHDYERMCREADIDLVIIATPWGWHVPMAVAAMKNGKHAATEVPAATTLDGAWELVETAEKYQKHCVMLENCNYGRREMMVLNMVRQGVFGDIIHGAGGYIHDLRSHKLSGYYEGEWRVKYSIKYNGNLYPTHGLGPLANVMAINRGDRFDFLVSMSSLSEGLHDYAVEKFGPESKYAKAKFALGDVNVSLIKTLKGLTITLYHDTNLPTPYSRIDMVQGTKAMSIGYPDRIYIEGRSPHHQWEPLETYREEFDHPLWKKLETLAKGSGHGGMDFLEIYRLIQALRTGTPTDMDVYDAAALSSVVELSERSVANKSRPVDFPDFTRGFWKVRPPLKIPAA